MLFKYHKISIIDHMKYKNLLLARNISIALIFIDLSARCKGKWGSGGITPFSLKLGFI